LGRPGSSACAMDQTMHCIELAFSEWIMDDYIYLCIIMYIWMIWMMWMIWWMFALFNCVSLETRKPWHFFGDVWDPSDPSRPRPLPRVLLHCHATAADAAWANLLRSIQNGARRSAPHRVGQNIQIHVTWHS
jgi:hypothetical protein